MPQKPAWLRHPDTPGAVAFLTALAVPSLLAGVMLFLGARAREIPLAAALAIGSTVFALGFWTAASPLVLRWTQRAGLGVRFGGALLFSAVHVLVLVGSLMVGRVSLAPMTSGQVVASVLAIYLPLDVITCVAMVGVSRYFLKQKQRRG